MKNKKNIAVIIAAVIIGFCFAKITESKNVLLSQKNDIEVYCDDGYCDDYIGIVQSDGSIKLVERK